MSTITDLTDKRNGSGPDQADQLQSGEAATVAHAIPGRTRMRVKPQLRTPEQMAKVKEQLEKQEGVRSVSVNHRTGSVLIKHERHVEGDRVFRAVLGDVELAAESVMEVPEADSPYERLAGLTSGATLGLVVAGPAGGLLGAVIGEAVGGQLGEDAARTEATANDSEHLESQSHVTPWLDKLGKNTVGESAVVLTGGAIGSLLGPSGRAVGQRIGIIVGKRVEWHKLGVAGLSSSDAEEGTQPNDIGPNTGEAVPLEIIALTDRELDVLALFAADMSEEDIASQLNVRPGAMKRYIRMMCRKLDIKTPEEAATLMIIFMPLSGIADEPEDA